MNDLKTIEASPLPYQVDNPNWLHLVREQVAALRFGQVVVTVHDARVVQVEKLEKFRIEPAHR